MIPIQTDAGRPFGAAVIEHRFAGLHGTERDSVPHLSLIQQRPALSDRYVKQISGRKPGRRQLFRGNRESRPPNRRSTSAISHSTNPSVSFGGFFTYRRISSFRYSGPTPSSLKSMIPAASRAAHQANRSLPSKVLPPEKSLSPPLCVRDGSDSLRGVPFVSFSQALPCDLFFPVRGRRCSQG